MEGEVIPSYLTKIGANIWCGEFPTKRTTIEYLINECKVTQIVNLLPQTSETTSGGNLKNSWYTQFFPPSGISLVHHPFDPSECKQKGRYASDKQLELAKFYVKHAKELSSSLGVVFVHARKDLTDPMYLCFAMWALSKSDIPADPIEWISKNRYDYLHSDNHDVKAFLTLVWSVAQKSEEKTPFTLSKKKKI